MEIIPLVVILLLQFLYQFQKAAKKRSIKNKPTPSDSSSEGSQEWKNSSREFEEESQPDNPPATDFLNQAEEKLRDKFVPPAYDDFFLNEEESPHQKTIESKETELNKEAEEESPPIEEPTPPANSLDPLTSLKPRGKGQGFKKLLRETLKDNPKQAIVLNEIIMKPKGFE